MLWYQKKWLSGTSEDTAVYKTDSFEWTKDFITRHYSGLNLSFVASPFSAHLSGQFVLPPLLNSINTHADVQWERLSLSADESFNQKTAAADLTPAPVRLALGLPLFDWFSSNHSLEIDVGTMKVNSYTGTLGIFGFNASVNARPASDQIFNNSSHVWQSSGEETFRIISGALDYSLVYEPDPFWFNRLKTKFSLSGRLNQNFIMVTDSVLSWNIAWDFSVADFLDFNFTLNGQNARMFRYIPAFNRLVGLGQEQDRDFLTDLGKSFNIFQASAEDRASSYFKMSTVSLKAIHYLGDWQLTLNYTGQPTVQTVSGVQSMVWTFQFSAYVAWQPIAELKTTVSADKDKLTIQ